jgi:hypothetical protein
MIRAEASGYNVNTTGSGPDGGENAEPGAGAPAAPPSVKDDGDCRLCAVVAVTGGLDCLGSTPNQEPPREILAPPRLQEDIVAGPPQQPSSCRRLAR